MQTDILDIDDSSLELPEYAGFLLRLVALIIDSIILASAFWIIVLVLFKGVFTMVDHESSDEAAVFLVGGVLVFYVGYLIAIWLYFALMESSVKQGTLGKIIVGIKVTDMEDQRISFGRATGRYFGKFLSQLIFFIGYIMAAFTNKKQALHDMIAGTLVVRR